MHVVKYLWFVNGNRFDGFGKKRKGKESNAGEGADDVGLPETLLCYLRRSSRADAEERLDFETESLLRRIALRREIFDDEVILTSWAFANGVLIPFECMQKKIGEFASLPGGNEHIVFFDEGQQRVIKVTIPPNFGAAGRLVSYLRNHIDVRDCFGTPIRIEGAVILPEGVVIVVSQPFVCGREATHDEICSYFLEFGFCFAGNDSFYDGDSNRVVFDARPANVLVDSDGLILPIDIHIRDVVGGDRQDFWMGRVENFQ